MAGMRDKATHFYFGLNMERVWMVIDKDIVALIPKIEKALYLLRSEKG